MINEKCVNCGISHVPLYTGLDGRMHCADHIGLLVGAFLPEKHDKPKSKQKEKKS